MRIHLSREFQKEIKQKWFGQYKALEKIVNEWDPVGLIGGGAPEDEYDCLTTQILFLLYEGNNLEQIQEFILEELDDHFGNGLNNIRKEYHDVFIKKCNSASIKIMEWFAEGK